MDWLDALGFIIKMLGVLATLAWPGVVMYFLYTQREALTKVIESLKIKRIEAFGGKLETQLEENTKTIEQAAEVAAAKPPEAVVQEPAAAVERETGAEGKPQESASVHLDEGAGKSYAQVAHYLKSSPVLVIDQAWRDVRAAMCNVSGFRKRPREAPDLESLSDMELVVRTANAGRLNDKLVQAIVQLMRIHNDVTGMSIRLQPTQAEAADYVKNAGEVIGLLGVAGYHAGS